jgi:dolichyl-phosphate beta-glucosyltransferase
VELSIVIPAYNESKKIQKDIFAADKFIRENFNSGQIIIVDDGSKDGTYNIASSYQNEVETELDVIKLNKNSGKGAAIREGIKRSDGEIVLYADAGLTVPFNNALRGIELIKEGKCDIANGSRKLPDSTIIKKQDIDRRIISFFFGLAAKLFLHIPQNMTDTQCGFKVYKGKVAKELFSQLKINGFLFEIEIILLAIKKGYKVLEFPITWSCDRDSRLSVKKSSKNIIAEFKDIYNEFNKSTN